MNDLVHRTLFVAVAGSRAQGLHRPDSDVDLRGVAVPRPAELLGYRNRFEQADAPSSLRGFIAHLNPQEREAAAQHKVEGSIYAIAKFARLAADANPSILEALFCRDQEVRLCTALGHRLREARSGFLSMRAGQTFSQYGLQQLKRIQAHRRWLEAPPGGPPDRRAAGLSARPARNPTADEVAAEARHAREVRTWRQYQMWLQKRNAERAALESAHGYDTKHGAHLVRLLRMGREILETGHVHVWRGDRDADELKAIRAGAWSYERMVSWAETEAAAVRDIAHPVVPPQPDHAGLDALIVDLQRRALFGER
ncbi:MAG: nucleotidyltransferase domain-containing protein [Myxococcota bacterium]|nr:nucleotidyltransferase domain-containing protein [Myxococcota bacterium]